MLRSAYTAACITGIAVIMTMVASSLPAQERNTMEAAIDIGERLELFVDDYLVDSLNGVDFRLHEPVRQPLPKSPLITYGYLTILKVGDVFRGYYGDLVPANPDEVVLCCAESSDGIEWTYPEWGVTNIMSRQGRNVISSEVISPFIDTRPGVEPEARFKALLGGGGEKGKYPGRAPKFLYPGKSADGLHWIRVQDTPVLTPLPDSSGVFDSQNVAFWSEAENCYVCYVRTRRHSDRLRGISRATSPDFVNWSPLVYTDANLPGEQLYTNQTHPYFRAPHIYIALPTRYTEGSLMGKPVEGNSGSTDIMLMTWRAGGTQYQRTFKEAFIRPGLDPERWERKANYVALNVVPTGPEEMSIYHEQSGHRYTLRTDGFISVRAGASKGDLVTKPLVFAGDSLFVNFSTGAAGSLRVEVQDASGQALPGFSLEDCPAIVGDAIERRVDWTSNPNLGATAGTPVRLRFEIQECDLYSFRFRNR